MEELIEGMEKMSGEELYLKAQEFKETKDFNNYKLYLTMAANFLHEGAIHESLYPSHTFMNFLIKNLDYSLMFTFCDNTKKYAFSLYCLADLYEDGLGIEKDIDKSFELLNLSYEKGNKYTANNLGHRYHHGNGIEQNYEKAVHFYQIAADLGCRHGMNNLGYMYSHGLGVDVNRKIALDLFQKSVEKNNVNAMISLGYCYQQGLTVTKNYEKARELFEKAASDGCERALVYLSVLYQEYKRDKNDVITYFIKIGEVKYLKDIYGYDDDIMRIVVRNYELEKENIILKKENEEMRNHILASPDGELYFEALEQWKIDAQKI